MDTGSPLQDMLRQKLVGSYWVFGPSWGTAKTDRLMFLADGKIGNYDHPNERRWQIANGRLEIFDEQGGLMWAAASRYIEDQAFCMTLITPRDSNATFLLKEAGALAAPPPPAPARLPARASAAALSPADFLFPKDLAVTPTPLHRVRLVGSCMTALYHEAFQAISPDTKFDYLVFNYAGEIPPVADPYDLQYVQLPLRSVLTDRVIWATKFAEDGFAEDVLKTGQWVIDAMLESALAEQEKHGTLTLVSNFIVPQMSVATSLQARYSKLDISHIVRSLNDYLAAVLHKYKNVYLADVNGIAESIGKQYVLDDMIYFYSHNGAFFHEWVSWERPPRIEKLPHMAEFYASKRHEFAQAVWDQIIATYRIARQVDQVKAVVFDLDHTLWRGQLAEDYRAGDKNWPITDGWPLGIWEAVHHLRARGILVSICSKNDEAVVRREWENVVQPAFVSLDDFVSPKINWRPKAENILEICKEFNIKPRSVVFVDDNPVERAAVQAAIPDIRVIGSNPYLTRRILLWSPETQVPVLTNESARREDMIRNQIVREEERKTLTRDEFLASLQCRVHFIPISGREPEFNRVVELVNKTNQFNTTGKRWSQKEILDFCATGGDLLAFTVTDRFSEYGLVGVLFLRSAVIVQFVMSCRVLGMDVELYAVSHAVTLLRARQGGGAVAATLVETADNAPCREVFARAGFTAAGDGRFELAAGATPVTPAHVKEM
jgi:FkbH-like protein